MEQNSPGLVMTRSFGDALAHTVGCSSIPEQFNYKIHNEDKILVIASDGIWEFLSNTDVASIVFPYYYDNNPEGAAEKLIKKSYE